MKIRNAPMLIGLAAVLIVGTVACSQGPAGTAPETERPPPDSPLTNDFELIR